MRDGDIVTGLNILADVPPHDGQPVGVFHLEGREAADAFVKAHKEELDNLFSAIRLATNAKRIKAISLRGERVVVEAELIYDTEADEYEDVVGENTNEHCDHFWAMLSAEEQGGYMNRATRNLEMKRKLKSQKQVNERFFNKIRLSGMKFDVEILGLVGDMMKKAGVEYDKKIVGYQGRYPVKNIGSHLPAVVLLADVEPEFHDEVKKFKGRISSKGEKLIDANAICMSDFAEWLVTKGVPFDAQ